MMSLLYDRFLRLENTFATVNRTHITNLCLDIELPFNDYRRLDAAAWHYYYIASKYKFVNVTPNGMMMPKVENIGIYTEFAKAFFLVMKELGVFHKFVAWNVPAIRLKPAALPSANLRRPRASEYAHSDSWLGWDQSAIVFMIPLAGDVKGNWVQFFEHELDETWIEILPSFTCTRALEMVAQCKGMPWNYKIGHIYPNDIGMVHQSKREEHCGWRMSAEVVGYLDYPKTDSFGAATHFGRMIAEEILNGTKRFTTSLHMGEIGEYTEQGRALDLSIV